jgi:hypothetical protein
MATLTIVEMALTGERSERLFESVDERVPLCEIIRWRVREQVAERRLKLARELPQPSPSERALNGDHVPRALAIDWEKEYARALDAFAAHQFIVLVDDRQVDDLDTLVAPRDRAEVTFLRLTPLVGG